MAHFAQVKNGIVLRVIVAEQDFIDSGAVGDPANWVQTSYNAKEGDGLRKNYAGVGYIYDKTLDAFLPPKPFDSWSLDQEKGIWNPPTESPKDGKIHEWDEITTSWKEVANELI